MKKRWTVAEVVEFCGWEFLQKMMDGCECDRHRLLVSMLFSTGGRISEVLALERRHILLDEDELNIIVRSMPVAKRYKKVSKARGLKCVEHCTRRWLTSKTPRLPTEEEKATHNIEVYDSWKTEPVMGFRTLAFPKAEPLALNVAEYIKFDTERLFEFNYEFAYKLTVKLGKKLGVHTPPHWFRAQRASQLAFEYGFGPQDLVEFFQWKDYTMAFHYASKGYKSIAAKMKKKTYE